MNKFTFIYESSYKNSCKVVYETDSISVDDVLENFQKFLKAAGYESDGSLEFSTKEDEDFSITNDTIIQFREEDFQYAAAQPVVDLNFDSFTSFDVNMGSTIVQNSSSTATISESKNDEPVLHIRV